MSVRLGHVGLAVGDLDAAIAFFTDFLGFTLTARLSPFDRDAIPGITGLPGAAVDEIAYVRCGEWAFELLHYSAPEPRQAAPRPCDPGGFHWLVECDDVTATIDAAGEHGFAGIAPPYAIAVGPNVGKFGTYLYHPDGLVLEVIGPAKAE